MSYRQEREDFVARFVAEAGTAKPDSSWHERMTVARLVLRNAATHGRLSVESCNGHPAQGAPHADTKWLNKVQAAWDARIEKQQPRVEARLQALVAPYGFTVDTSGDPRGYTVKLHFPSGVYNTWGGKESGYGVPQRN